MKKEYIEHALICVDTKPSSSADNAELKVNTMIALIDALKAAIEQENQPVEEEK